MNKTLKIYLVLLMLIIIGSVALEFSKPKPIVWTPTYNESHKIPYGTFVLFNELPNLFPKSTIEKVRVSPYEYFRDHYNWMDEEYNISGSYLNIEDSYTKDPESTKELLNFAREGNNVFLSSRTFETTLLDSLDMGIKYQYNFSGKATLSLANPILSADSITIEKGLDNFYFNKLDSTRTTVLGYQTFDSERHINFVKVAYGSGNVYLHLQPVSFTNYHLLKADHKKYPAAVLSYLPDETLYFDSKNKVDNMAGASPLRFILSKPPLRWAWYLALTTLVFFMIFNAKRRQRIIRVIKPLQNTTVAFTKTIGNLYYETQDHNTIIEKKITYFFEHIRRVYFLETQNLDDKFVKNLSLKSNVKQETVQYLVNVIRQLRSKRICTEADVLRLNKAIENFYTK
ncbi:DUF4350 domain-containing protein [Gaetbulibacter aestuarii]|uniref:DUF4350 domain-containing protein n=1 Tax=Gaetbulibacter aestuarii TaxID=1502358 RepID=A0ABW7MXJ7_9FLAO